ncbi:hypothetical protein FRX31_011430 [Thalictrum thalictroides]|uniref:Uncharacterized protein n=1 Tax=Thalictrum thalictroides TaxID=46969 RepID=A0A7J6WQT7_THATH|nr:hypothetical protein FRX31_011430 [Thalictrum thalictroides]
MRGDSISAFLAASAPKELVIIYGTYQIFPFFLFGFAIFSRLGILYSHRLHSLCCAIEGSGVYSRVYKHL